MPGNPRTVRRVVRAILATATVGMSGIGATATAAAAQSGSPATSPPPQAAPVVTKRMLDSALAKLPGVVRTAMRRTGVPGVAVSVVWRDRTVFANGFGVREEGKVAKITPDTVFQLASTSKPIASTVVAGVEAIGLDVDASWNTVSGVILATLPSSRTPKPFANTVRSRHTTETATPGTPVRRMA